MFCEITAITFSKHADLLLHSGCKIEDHHDDCMRYTFRTIGRDITYGDTLCFRCVKVNIIITRASFYDELYCIWEL